MAAPAQPRWMMFAALATVAATTLIGFLVHRYLQLADLVVLYMCCITVVATRFEKRYALPATLLCVASLDYFFISPRYTFSVEDVRYIGTFGMMLGVGWVVGGLSGRIRDQVREAERREQYTSALYRLGAILAEGGDALAIQIQVETYLHGELGIPVLVLLPDALGTLQPRSRCGVTLTPEDLGAPQWAMEHRQTTGVGSNHLPATRGLYLPLGSADHPVGVLALFPEPGGSPLAGRNLLEAIAAQVSLALERARLAWERSEARIRAEQEHLRSILLSSISHDLRTPLATITGATTSLLTPGPEATAEDQQMLLLSVHQESQRLEKLVNNLLNLTRLESGQVQVNKEWVPMDEVVGSVLNRLEPQLEGRVITTAIQDLWVPLDPVLLEQVLANLLDNALKFSPSGSALELRSWPEPGRVLLTITDHGPGLAQGEEERIFEKLYRGSCSPNAPGAGLGLAICKAIIEAHGGTIQARSGAHDGAQVTITLPVDGIPPTLAETTP